MGLGKTLQSICIIAGDHYMRGVQFRVISLHCVLANVMDERGWMDERMDGWMDGWMDG